MMTLLNRTLLFLLLLPGYANSADIDISGQISQGYCSKYFGFVSFDFENNTDEWIEITRLDLSFGSAVIDANVSIPVGERLAVWRDAMEYRNQNNQQLAAMILGGLSLAAAAKGSNSASAKSVAGYGLAGFSLLSLSDSLELRGKLPQSHLLSLPLLIPPGLRVYRWVVLQTNEHKDLPYLEELEMDIGTADERTLKKRVYFRGNKNSCVWQKNKNPGVN